jgi:hypothetical protein
MISIICKTFKRLLTEVFWLADCSPLPGVIESFAVCQCYAY